MGAKCSRPENEEKLSLEEECKKKCQHQSCEPDECKHLKKDDETQD